MRQPLTKYLIYHFANITYNEAVCKKLGLTIDNQLESLRPPFLALVNHTSNNDIFVTAKVLSKYTPNYVCAIDQIARNKAYYHLFGAIPKRQFANEIEFVRVCKNIVNKGRPIVMFPEARLSVDGKMGYFGESVAKFAKLLDVPLVIITINGNYLGKSRWARRQRHVPVRARARLLYTAEQLKKISVDVLYDNICKEMDYDEYEWQRNNKIFVPQDYRCTGLEDILYMCPHCKSEFNIATERDTLTCRSCSKQFVMDEYGVITDVDSVSVWYEKERQTVKQELLDGSYVFDSPCTISSLSDISAYVSLGEGNIHQDKYGITLTIGTTTKFYPPTSFYAISFDVGKRLFISENNVTYKIDLPYDKAKQLTKVALAVEENYKLNKTVD